MNNLEVLKHIRESLVSRPDKTLLDLANLESLISIIKASAISQDPISGPLPYIAISKDNLEKLVHACYFHGVALERFPVLGASAGVQARYLIDNYSGFGLKFETSEGHYSITSYSPEEIRSEIGLKPDWDQSPWKHAQDLALVKSTLSSSVARDYSDLAVSTRMTYREKLDAMSFCELDHLLNEPIGFSRSMVGYDTPLDNALATKLSNALCGTVQSWLNHSFYYEQEKLRSEFESLRS